MPAPLVSTSSSRGISMPSAAMFAMGRVRPAMTRSTFSPPAIIMLIFWACWGMPTFKIFTVTLMAGTVMALMASSMAGMSAYSAPKVTVSMTTS